MRYPTYTTAVQGIWDDSIGTYLGPYTTVFQLVIADTADCKRKLAGPDRAKPPSVPRLRTLRAVQGFYFQRVVQTAKM